MRAVYTSAAGGWRAKCFLKDWSLATACLMIASSFLTIGED